MKSPGKNRPLEEKCFKPPHSRVISQCRDLLLKSLNPEIFCSQSFLSRLPVVFKAESQEADRKVERLTHFLDNLEQTDRRSFEQFMDVLREHNRGVHGVLEQALRTLEIEEEEEELLDDEVLCGERATMTGHSVRDLLKRHKYQINNRLFDDHLPRGLLDSEAAACNGYVTCQVVASRGKAHDKPWIKHDKRRKVRDSSDDNDPFMAVLTRDLLFKTIKTVDIPDLVKKPVRCTQAFVADERSNYNFSTANLARNVDTFNASTLRLSYRTDLSNNEEMLKIQNVQTPPPLPPKPDSLSPIPRMKLQDRLTEETLLKIEADVSSCSNSHSTFTIPPPIPARQRFETNLKPPPILPALNPAFRDLEPLNMVRISSYPKAFSNYEADDGMDDDNISLSYFIEPEDVSTTEGPYEAIDQNAANEDKERETFIESQNIYSQNEHNDEATRPQSINQVMQAEGVIEEAKIENLVPVEESTNVVNTASDELLDQPGCSDVSVSRSSSGVSTTVKTRDSGVDSVVSHSLHDSPFCGTDATEDLDTLIPETAENQCPEQGSKQAGITEPSYYEDIDLMNDHSGHYLDPRSDEPDGRSGTLGYLGSEQKILMAGTLLMCDYFPACKCECSSHNEYVDENQKSKLAAFKGSRICYDREGSAYYVNFERLKRYGDPIGESWFYPVPLTTKEATLFLRQEKQNGCFLVYQSADFSDDMPTKCFYYLSLTGELGEVVHYPIAENYCGDVMIEGHDRSFLTLSDLVQYFRRNRSCLIARLRRPLKESRMPIIPGHHYPANYELLRKSIRLYGKIISEGRFGLTCLGSYGQQQVFVKALQSDSLLEEDDDFLNEALILMNTSHEHIIKLVGVCFGSRPFFILTENFGMGTLKDSMINGFLSDKSDIYFDMCVQMVSAMVHLERQHFILHRNLSASNFLLSANYVVKLFNFERATRVDDDGYMACSSEEIPIRWSPPEVLRDCHYSTKSDVWSLAVVFWELFSQGQLPYGHLSEQETALHIVEKGRLGKPAECETFMFSIMQQCWRYRASARPTFCMLENKVKGQCNLYFSDPQRKFAEVASPLHSSASLSDDLQLILKSSKRSSQSGTNTPLISTPTFRTSNPYSDSDVKTDDCPRSMSVSNSKRHVFSSARSTIERSSMVDTCSASIPFNQFSNGDVSRGSKLRKSWRNLLKVSKSKQSG